MKLKNHLGSKSFNQIPFIECKYRDELAAMDRTSEIAISAYFKAEARGYEPGHELQDWLEAEAEVMR